MDPMSAAPMGTSEPPGSDGGSKAPLVLGVVLLLALLAIGGAVFLLMSGGPESTTPFPGTDLNDERSP